MIGTDAVRVTFGASTASRPMRTPSTTMHRERLVARLERDLVVVLERPDLARLHLPLAEVREDRLLHVAVDAPVVALRLRDAELTPVERRNRLCGRHRRISAARSHSASVG